MGMTLWNEGLATRDVKHRSVLLALVMLVGHPVVIAVSDLFAAKSMSCVTSCS